MVPEAAQAPSAKRDLDHRIRLEWYLVTLALTLVTFALSYFSPTLKLDLLDHTFYDTSLSVATRSEPLDDIVIVAIDDDSIADIGFWPWRRSVHAQLLDRLSGARAIGIDLVLADTNPVYPDDDARLAQSMQQQGRVVLPLVLHPDLMVSPLPVLADVAAGLGSINAVLDSDGAVRNMRPQFMFRPTQSVEHLVLSLLETAGETRAAERLRAHRADTLGIAYAGPPGSFTHYPYAQVLSGQIPASAFDGKLVLVGAWATGLGDFFSVPLSSGGQLMAGVEVLANALQSALQDGWIHRPGPVVMATLATVPVLLLCMFLPWLSPRRAFVASMLVMIVIAVMGWALLQYARLWLSPTASLLGVVFAYPVWSWRSQEAALKHIDIELEKLHGEKLLHGQLSAHDNLHTVNASLPARIVKLNHAVATLRQAVSQREQTLRFLSHDMRSPQSAILALTQLQRHGQTPLSQAELLDRVDGYADKTLSLVDGFVQLARAETMAMTFRPVDLVDMLAQECDERWPQAQQRGMRVNFDPRVSLALTLADPAMLARVFGNLLDNALKYSPDGTEVHCELDADGQDWCVQIKDQGRGIGPAEQASLFEPFTRFEDDRPDNPDGSGLGLAFVQAVVRRHDGEITVISALGQGSTFCIRLPGYRDDTDQPLMSSSVP